MAIFHLDSLVNDSCYFSQVNHRQSFSTSWHLIKKTGISYVAATASSVLGSGFKFSSPFILGNNENTGLAVYDELTNILPTRSAQSTHFWRKFGKPFASMLDTADFPISAQVSFLTYIYARVLGMMGPLNSRGPASYMTYDGSPVELSWVFPSHATPGDGNKGRHVRFALEPIDPRSGRLLKGSEVLRYLTSSKGGLGLVNCDEGALGWSGMAEQFLYSGDYDSESRFFVGFDFSRSGRITLKAYYIPRSLDQSFPRKPQRLGLWNVDYTPLRSLITDLDATLLSSLSTLISYAEGEDAPFKPRLQILSMDCVPNKNNRLKVYCRPLRGTSWNDARRAFTLAGRLDCPKMDHALSRLETLWNLLFPFAHSSNNRDLDDGLRLCDRTGHEDISHRRSPDHPTGGLLFYYCLIPCSDMILPKVYLPVSRYCVDDLAITKALEQFYALDDAQGSRCQDTGWVAREVSSAFNHRQLEKKTGIYTYVTFALKRDYECELTTYFSPEVWETP